MKQAKGFFGRRKNVWTVAKNAVEKAMCYAYRDRKVNKRNFRALWINVRRSAAGKRDQQTQRNQPQGMIFTVHDSKGRYLHNGRHLSGIRRG